MMRCELLGFDGGAEVDGRGRGPACVAGGEGGGERSFDGGGGEGGRGRACVVMGGEGGYTVGYGFITGDCFGLPNSLRYWLGCFSGD